MHESAKRVLVKTEANLLEMEISLKIPGGGAERQRGREASKSSWNADEKTFELKWRTKVELLSSGVNLFQCHQENSCEPNQDCKNWDLHILSTPLELRFIYLQRLVRKHFGIFQMSIVFNFQFIWQFWSIGAQLIHYELLVLNRFDLSIYVSYRCDNSDRSGTL